MRNKEEVKETIITVATELIEQSGGDIKAITARIYRLCRGRIVPGLRSKSD